MWMGTRIGPFLPTHLSESESALAQMLPAAVRASLREYETLLSNSRFGGELDLKLR